jgi:hypothetical protein
VFRRLRFVFFLGLRVFTSSQSSRLSPRKRSEAGKLLFPGIGRRRGCEGKGSFENDGQGTVERSVREEIQGESGACSEGLLIVPYLTGDESLEVQYVHVRKPDGTAAGE